MASAKAPRSQGASSSNAAAGLSTAAAAQTSPSVRKANEIGSSADVRRWIAIPMLESASTSASVGRAAASAPLCMGPSLSRARRIGAPRSGDESARRRLELRRARGGGALARGGRRLGARERQIDLERGALAGLALDPDAPAHRLDDLLGDVEPQA